MTTVLTGVRRYLIMVFLCISLVISEAEHLFLAVCISSLEKCLFSFSARCCCCCCFFLSCMSCLYILHINPLLVISFANIFSHLVGHLFIDGFQQILSLVRSYLFIFAFFSSYFRRQIQEIFLQFMSKSTLPIFSSRNFLLWYLVLPLGL